jgi:hypothetical protein
MRLGALDVLPLLDGSMEVPVDVMLNQVPHARHDADGTGPTSPEPTSPRSSRAYGCAPGAAAPAPPR